MSERNSFGTKIILVCIIFVLMMICMYLHRNREILRIEAYDDYSWGIGEDGIGLNRLGILFV